MTVTPQRFGYPMTRASMGSYLDIGGVVVCLHHDPCGHGELSLIPVQLRALQSLISLCRCSLMAGVERPPRSAHTTPAPICKKALPHHLGSDWMPRHLR